MAVIAYILCVQSVLKVEPVAHSESTAASVSSHRHLLLITLIVLPKDPIYIIVFQ